MLRSSSCTHATAYVQSSTDCTRLPNHSGLLARLEKAHGFNYDPEWLLLDQNLSIDLPSLWMWDWFHTYLADGVFVQEVDACMEAFGEHGFGMHTLNEYIKLWSWPRGFARASKDRESQGESLHRPPSRPLVWL